MDSLLRVDQDYKRWLRSLLVIVASFVCCAGFEEPFGVGLERSFELIALQNEYGPKRWSPVRKWVKPVAIFLDSRAGLKDVQLLLTQEHIANLSKITGHRIYLEHRKKNANLILVFERESLLQPLVKELLPDQNFTDEFLNTNVCFGNFNVNRDYEISKAVVIIPTDRARAHGKLPACIVEELTQVMGLVNDSVEVYPSIFNDKSIDDELSKHDIRLLKILYNQKIKAGMQRTEVMPIVRELITKQAY
jgi:hypothetical protein